MDTRSVKARAAAISDAGLSTETETTSASTSSSEKKTGGAQIYSCCCRAKKKPIPVFYGTLAEDPIKFLDQLERYCDEMKGEETLSFISNTLNGEAAEWWKTWETIETSLEMFKIRFLNRFDNEKTHKNLLAAFMSTPQTENESSEVYLQTQMRFYERIRKKEPTITEKQAVNVAMDQLQMKFRNQLKIREPANFREAFAVAQTLDNHILSETPKKIGTTSKTAVPPTTPPRNRREYQPPQEESLPRCWYCPGRHLNKDCPRRREPTGNDGATGYPRSGQRR